MSTQARRPARGTSLLVAGGHRALRAFGVLLLASAAALAQSPADYPKAKAITIVSPTAAGSAADTIARLVAQKIGEGFATAIVENRPGAGGNIAAQHVKRAAPDGYTLFVHSNSLVINPSLYANAGTPSDVVNRLNTELNRIFELEDVKTRLGALGFSVARNTPAEFAQVIRSEIPKWAKAAKESGAKAE